MCHQIQMDLTAKANNLLRETIRQLKSILQETSSKTSNRHQCMNFCNGLLKMCEMWQQAVASRIPNNLFGRH